MGRVIIIFCYVLCSMPQAYGQMQGDGSLLLDAKKAIDRNTGGIATWSARVVQNHSGKGPGAIRQMEHAGVLTSPDGTRAVEIKFLYVADGNLLRTSTRVDDGIAVSATDGLRTLDSYVSSVPYFVGSQDNNLSAHTRSIVIDSLSTEKSGVLADFDPFEVFEIHGAPPSAFLQRQYELRHVEHMSKFRVSSEGDLITLVSESNSGQLVWRYLFSLEFSGMPVLVEGIEGPKDEPDSLTRIENHYTEVDGVWLPSSTKLVLAGKGFKKSVEMSWQDHVLNEPIDPNEFTLESMGLLPGNRINNKKTGEQQIIKEREFLETFGDQLKAKRSSGGVLAANASNVRTALMYLTAGIAGALCLLYFIRTRKRSVNA